MTENRSPSAASSHRRQLTVVLIITTGILVAEIVGATVSGSLALLADAGHMLTDAAGISLSLLAIWFAARPPTSDRTFGYYRLEILAAVVNAVLLFAVGGFVIYEGIRHLVTPPAVESGIMLAFGLGAVLGNGCSLWLLHRGQRDSLNIRGAFLEVLGDMFGAAAVIVSAVIISLTGFDRADAIASLVIGMLILPRTWRLLRDATDVLLEATPKGVDLEEVRKHILETPGVSDAHDLHAWSLTSGMNVVSVHVVLSSGAVGPVVLDALSACLDDHFDVEHSTFQLEPAGHREHESGMHD